MRKRIETIKKEESIEKTDNKLNLNPKKLKIILTLQMNYQWNIL